MVDLWAYKKCFPENSVQAELISAVKDNFLNHLWYLSEKLVVFALFDDNLSDQGRRAIADQLLLQPRPPILAPSKPTFQGELLTDDRPSIEIICWTKVIASVP